MWPFCTTYYINLFKIFWCSTVDGWLMWGEDVLLGSIHLAWEVLNRSYLWLTRCTQLWELWVVRWHSFYLLSAFSQSVMFIEEYTMHTKVYSKKIVEFHKYVQFIWLDYSSILSLSGIIYIIWSEHELLSSFTIHLHFYIFSYQYLFFLTFCFNVI